jgi:hypothetical protein
MPTSRRTVIEGGPPASGSTPRTRAPSVPAGWPAHASTARIHQLDDNGTADQLWRPR